MTIGALLIGDEVKRLRASLGLSPIDRLFDWWYSPELILGMFPSWYGKPQHDWPAQLVLVGFPLNYGQPEVGISEKTLSFCSKGDRPIAFTFGTGMMHARELFELGTAVCKKLGVRGIILTKYENQLPRKLPSFVHHSSFEPFHKLFNCCAAVVHHGGIGTVAMALSAGTPQLILPFAFDQLDNGVRVQRLQAGEYCEPRKLSLDTLEQTLVEVLNVKISHGAKAIQRQSCLENGLERAADLIADRLNSKTPIRNQRA
ncbi:MAG TPA: nucleotide disphospho-sugar-binding domain-containing protein [Verrucomicrobiae bacterium]|nr:nucleotide disphospho-sugar-binding domain-containing protein [Verrucomicrobiae bacterium]